MADYLGSLKTAISNRYTIQRQLGACGMATAYVAEV